MARFGLLVAAQAALVAASPLARDAPAARANLSSCTPDKFASLALPASVQIEKVAPVQEGGSYGEGFANVPYPIDPTGLPELCAVTVKVTSSQSSSYRFGLFLPTEWKGRMLTVGNGGFAGGINWRDMYVYSASSLFVRLISHGGRQERRLSRGGRNLSRQITPPLLVRHP